MIDRIDALAADIDMTLTDKGGKLPELLKKVFMIMHENGILLGLATGREINDKILNQGRKWGLPFEFDFIIGMNGGMIYDSASDQMWTTEFLSRGEMKDILTYMKPLIDKYSISVNAEGGGNRNAMNIGKTLMEAAARRGYMFEDKTGDIDAFCEKPTFKLLFRTDAAYDREIRETFLRRFSDQYQIFATFPGSLEVMHKGICKGDGMKKYADQHGISLENVIAFGDNENDNSLLEVCGWGVCMINGAESTKKCADDITEYDCMNAGVGQYLIKNYLGPNCMI